MVVDLGRYDLSLTGDAFAARQGDEAFVSSVSLSCPNVLAAANLLPGSLISRAAAAALGEEVGADLDLATFAPIRRKVLAALSGKIEKLRWSASATRMAIKHSLEGQRNFWALPPSDLCSDARALAANPEATPPGTLQFLATFGRVGAGSGLRALVSTMRRFDASDPYLGLVGSSNAQLVLEAKALRQSEGPKLLDALGLSG